MLCHRSIGVLDLQGGVVEHLDHLERVGIPAARVRQPGELSGLAGLIIPGGESTCLFRLMTSCGLTEAVPTAVRQGLKVWGTCAGAILLARSVAGEGDKLGLIDIEVERNAFGSQLESFTTVAHIPAVSDDELPLTFIRAPKIRRAGPGVDVLLRQNGYIAMAESAEVLVTVFHPELTPVLACHAYFARKCGLQPRVATSAPPHADQRCWQVTSWTRHVPVR